MLAYHSGYLRAMSSDGESAARDRPRTLRMAAEHNSDNGHPADDAGSSGRLGHGARALSMIRGHSRWRILLLWAGTQRAQLFSYRICIVCWWCIVQRAQHNGLLAYCFLTA